MSDDVKTRVVDYSKGLIYKLCCSDPEVTDIYIGSTTNFIQRKKGHKKSCNNENNPSYNCYVYQIIREHGGFENWDMIQIEEYKSNNKKELESRERYWIETLKSSLNKAIPTRNMKEYREDNRTEILLKHRQYNEKNRETILLKAKQKYTCECGSTLRISTKARHERTHKHQAFINNS
jgi:hypothetical protein